LDFFSQLVTQFREMFNGLSTGRKIVFLGVLVGAIIAIVTLVMISQRSTFVVLYSNLSSEEAGGIVSKLKEQKIPYRLSSGGASILVPSDKLYETRLGLAKEGLPLGGVGFEIFDETKLGMTEFAQNVNYLRALQGELTRTINQLAEVEQSRVHIVMPKSSLFIEEQEEATASVVVKVKPGARLNQGQLQGIVHLVASGVEGLKPEKIIVMDNHGQILAGGREASLSSQLTNTQQEMRRDLEKNLERSVQTMLERAVGRNKAIARVSVTLDFEQTERTEEKYDPNSVAVRSEQISGEKSKGTGVSPRGVPGVVSNLPSNTQSADITGGKTEFQKKNETINYEISKITSHVIESIGDIVKLSAAVIVDGTYEVTKGKDGKEDKKYLPRPEEEMERLRDIVKMAVGYDADRGDQVEVVNMQMETVSLMEEEDVSGNRGFKTFWFPLVRLAVIFIAIIFLFFFVVRPLIIWLTGGKTGSDFTEQLPKTVEELEAGIEVTKELPSTTALPSTKEKIRQIVQEDTERTAQLIRHWISEGN